jgi:5-methylthioribose kinase
MADILQLLVACHYQCQNHMQTQMIRRIIGISHVEDLECISDATVRASCEQRALRIAIKLVKDAATFTNIAQVTALARSAKQQ